MYIIPNSQRKKLSNKYKNITRILFFSISLIGIFYLINYNVEIIGENDNYILYFVVIPIILGLIITSIISLSYIKLVFNKKYGYTTNKRLTIIIKDLMEAYYLMVISFIFIGNITWKEISIYYSSVETEKNTEKILSFSKSTFRGTTCQIYFKNDTKKESIKCPCRLIDSILNQDPNKFKIELTSSKTIWNNRIVKKYNVINNLKEFP